MLCNPRAEYYFPLSAFKTKKKQQWHFLSPVVLSSSCMRIVYPCQHVVSMLNICMWLHAHSQNNLYFPEGFLFHVCVPFIQCTAMSEDLKVPNECAILLTNIFKKQNISVVSQWTPLKSAKSIFQLSCDFKWLFTVILEISHLWCHKETALLLRIPHKMFIRNVTRSNYDSHHFQ